MSFFILLREDSRAQKKSEPFISETQKRHKNVHFTPNINKLVNGYVVFAFTSSLLGLPLCLFMCTFVRKTIYSQKKKLKN